MQMASGKSEIFEAVLKFMPDWVQITVIALVVLAVLVSWGVKLKRRIDYRRAVRSGRPVHAAAQYGQRSGADYLGAYAPQQPTAPPQPAPVQQSGADFLGAYAPQNRQGNGSV
ncbi:membrane protein [Streptomyces sp. WM6386]|nr:membrane protein [Streptomyces sp. WM6386]